MAGVVRFWRNDHGEEKWCTTDVCVVYTMRRRGLFSSLASLTCDIRSVKESVFKLHLSLVGCSHIMAGGLADFVTDRLTDRPEDSDH